MSNVKKLDSKSTASSRIKDLVDGIDFATNKEGDLCRKINHSKLIEKKQFSKPFQSLRTISQNIQNFLESRGSTGSLPHFITILEAGQDLPLVKNKIENFFRQVNPKLGELFVVWLKNPDKKNIKQCGPWPKNTGLIRVALPQDSNYRLIISGTIGSDVLFLDYENIFIFSHKEHKYKDICESKLKQPEFFFGKDGLNDWQHTYKGSDKSILQIGEFRSGHPYTNLNQRIKYYFEKFGQPDFVHVINDEKSLALKAVYAEKGKDMIQLWSFVNIRQEAGWKAFEVAAQKAGYKIKRFSKGSIEDSRGYWLDGKEDGNMGESMENETVEIDNVDVMLSAIKELQAKAQSQEPETMPAPVDVAAVVVEPVPEVTQPSQTLPCVLSSRIHKSFTDVADDLFALGFMNTDLRIALSSCISDALIAFEMSVKEKCPQAEAILIDREAAEEVL